MQIVAYGGGTDSTAMILEMLRRNEVIDYITFADTGGEKPHTYEYISMFGKWLKEHHGLSITVLKKDSIYSSLEDNCLVKKMLPSIAYGYKSCSDNYKIQPQDKFFNNLPASKKEWSEGRKIVKCIGYDLDEERRAKKFISEKYIHRYPLIEWEMEREDCITTIKNTGLDQPGKSACFFCPSSKKVEILELRDKYPHLMSRAIEMERNAELTSIKGLGRRFSWEQFINGQCGEEPVGEIEKPCGCYDS